MSQEKPVQNKPEHTSYFRGNYEGEHASLFVDKVTGEEWRPTTVDKIHYKDRVVYNLTNGSTYMSIAEKGGRFYRADQLGTPGQDVTDQFNVFTRKK